MVSTKTNFFSPCCKTSTNKIKFGICDDQVPKGEPSNEPAYLYFINENEWVAIVENTSAYKVDFYAIDKCVIQDKDFLQPPKRADGMLVYNQEIIFVELKEKNQSPSDLVKDGLPQLENTIRMFNINNPKHTYNIRAQLVNKLLPNATYQGSKIRKFAKDTGCLIETKQLIRLL